ncbi:MAG: Bax inhibitor-1/YccA family protein [Muribaculaceae bacterium]
MNDNFNYVQSSTVSSGTLVNKVMRRVYVKMFVAMLVTAVTSMYVSTNETILQLIFGNSFVTFGLIISQILVVVMLSGRINKMSIFTASLLFYLYSVLTGVVFSAILLLYTSTSVGMTFLITAGVFAAMSIYGFITSNDLTKFGSIMFMALIGLIVCSVVNIFLKSSGLEWIISLVGVAIFIGLTAWDTQKIKRMAAYTTDGVTAEKLATVGALSLYLDFVNLFLYLLRFFGSSRN